MGINQGLSEDCSDLLKKTFRLDGTLAKKANFKRTFLVIKHLIKYKAYVKSCCQFHLLDESLH